MKTVLITGGSRGIGAACARLFAQHGYAVAVNYREKQTAAQTLCSGLPCAAYYQADVSDTAEVQRMTQQVFAEFGGIDVLVNSAGVASQQLFQDISDDELHRLLDVNLLGAMKVTRAVLPQMVRRHSGAIISLSSIWGMVGASCEVAYSAAKAGIIGFTKALAKEVGPSGITVNCVAPGVIETDMTAALTASDRQTLTDETPISRLGTPEDIANAVYYLAAGQTGFITGQILSPNGGFVI